MTYRNEQVEPKYTTGAVPDRHITQGVNANILWVVRTPERFEFWINAALVATAPLEMATGAYIGVVGQSWKNLTAPVSMDVDDLLVWAP